MSRLNLENEFDPETADQLYAALSQDYTRRVLNYFRESTDRVATLDDLAEYVATSPKSCPPCSPKQVAVRLHHCGLPKLADAGVLDYDPRSKTVRCWDHPLIEVESVDSLVEVG